MLSLTLAEVAAACGGRLEVPDPQLEVRRVCTDSRGLQPGDLFVGLQGERFDGDKYAAQALADGATAVVVRAGAAAALPASAARIVVDDGLKALQDLATAVRRGAGVKVVGITGSAGKTSTKDILKALLKPVARTVATAANLNNEIGVPLTLLEVERSTEVAVVEMAMRGAGQIRDLARVAEPDVGVITNIAPVHLELVGTIEDVAAAKAELIEELTDGGTAVVPADERLLDRHVQRYPRPRRHLRRRGRGRARRRAGAARREHARAARRVRAPRAHGLQLHRRPLPARRAGRRGRVRRARLPPRRGRGGRRSGRLQRPPRRPLRASRAAACCSTTPTTPTRSP